MILKLLKRLTLFSRLLFNYHYLKLIIALFFCVVVTKSNAQILSNFPCYAVAEDNGAPNFFFEYDPLSQSWTNVGVTGTGFIESIATDPINDIIYAMDAGILGTIDVATGAFSAIGTLGTGDGAIGNILLNDVDGLSYDPANEILWASHRISGNGPNTNDLLFKIDPATASVIPGEFANGDDYVIVEEVFDSTFGGSVYDVDDIAYNPYTGILYAIQNQDGPGVITSINQFDGSVEQIIIDFPDDDVEGLGITYLSELYGTTGDNGTTGSQNTFIFIDIVNSSTQTLNTIDPTGNAVDFESFDCLTAVNDLALQKVISSVQPQPILSGDVVTYQITVFNQGDIPNEDIVVSDYIPMGLSLVDQDWSSLSPQLASYNIPGPLNPGQSITFDIDLKVGPTANGTIANYAEISSSFNEDINIANGEDTPLPDVDSVPNNVNDETGDVIIDDQTNGSGPNANQDEDDHDIATFGIGNCIAAGAEYFPCYAVSEDNSAPNTLYLFDQAQNVWVKIGVTGTNFVEAIAADPINNILYAIDGGVLGRLNTLTGAFTAIGTLGTANGENGSILIDDVDGLTYDPINNILIGSHRIGGSGPGTNDILIKINPLTGTLIPSSFVDSNGNPADYAVVEEAFDSTLGAVVYDVDDIALNPYTKELFAIQNQDGPGLITIINSTNGEIDIVVYDTPDDDLEGLGFNGYGELFATSGNNGATGSQNSFIAIDYLNSSSQILAKIDPSGEDVDFESFDCFAGYNDLALRETLSAGQESPFCAGETVTFEIEVFNQGLLSNENILITNYFSTDFELVAGDLWTDQGNQTATASLPCPLSPGESKTLEISFKISDQVACSQVTELAIDNFSEITVSFNPFFIDGNGFQIPLQDIDSEPDFLNNETDVVDNEINEQAITGDEDDHDIETIMVSPANPSAGSLTANSSVICSANNVTIISASPNGNILQGCFTATNENDIVIPDGYQLVYVLTEGTGLVIIDVSSTPSFTVNQLGDYTIHSLVYNPNTLDTSTIVPESTTGFDVNALLVQGGGNICGALNVAGAPVSVNNPSAGTLTAVAPIVCFNGSDAIIEATSNADAIIPTNYSTIYVLTRGAALVIEAVDGNPQFTVTQPGDFTIHTLVYDPNTLDLSIVTPNVTTGFDVNALLVQGGGNICGALDVEGASFVIQNPDAGSLTAVSSPIACLVENEATLTAEATTDPQFPLGYEVLYVLTSGGGLIIEATSTTPSFTVSQLGDYTIHTLVYDPTTLDLSIITPGVTTGFDVNALLVQGGGDICAALDVAGVPFTIGGNIGVTFEANSPTNATCGQAGVALIEISGGVEPYQISWSDGFSLEDRPNIEAGNYSVNVTDALGCTGSLEVTILGSATLELAITETCELTVVGADAVLDYTVSGGNEPYTIEVVDAIGGIVTPNQSGILPVWNTLSEGQYNLTVSDIDGCTTNQSFVICPYSCQLEGVLQEVVNVNCNGSSNGSITISATTNQGAEPITYVWLSGNGSIIDGETLPSINNISAGTYEVRLEDANGCTDELIFEITEPPAFVFVDCNSQDISTTAGMDGTATVIVDGGVAPYTYLWSNGQTTNPAINLSAGIYDLTITDANGCELQSNCTVQSPSCAGFNVDFNATPASCFNSTDGVIEIAATGTSGTVTYNWTPNVASGPLASGLSAGMYEVLVVDGVGCEVSIIGEILEPAELAGVIGKSDVVCFDDNNGTLDLQVSGGTEPYSYLWSNGMSTEDQIDIGPGNYTVTIEDANNCTIVRTDEILEPTELLFSNNSIVTNNISCNGNADGGVSVIVEGGAPPYQYGWSNGETNPTFSGYVAGIYSLTVVDNNGCSLNQDFEITQPEVLEVVDCNAEDVTTNSGTDGTATVVISGGTTPYSYQWSNGQTTNPAINLSAGSYDVVVTDANGCETQTTCSVQSPSCAGYNISVSNNLPVSCFGATDGTISVSVEGASGSIDYTWLPNVTAEPVATSLLAGTYEITAVDAVGCQASTTVEITQPEELTGVIEKTDIDCFGNQNGTINVDILGGTTPYQYLWSNGSTSEDLSNIGPGSYTLTITDANGCVLVLNEVVLQPTEFELLTSDVINLSCNESSDGSITVTPEGGVAPYLFEWSNGATTPSLSGAVAGNYSLTVTEANGCILEENFEITEPELLTVVDCNSEDISTTGSTDGTATIVISGGTAPYTYQWSNGQTSNPAINLSAGSYDVVVTDANGCETQTTCSVQSPSCAGYAITVNNNVPVSCFGKNDGTISVAVEGASGSVNYTWLPNVTTSPVATGLSAGLYEIVAIDAVGCEATITVQLNQPEELTGTIQKTDVKCFGDKNGALNVNVLGGTMPYQYLWSNSETVEDLTNTGPGTYILTITDVAGCSLILNDEVLQPTEFELTTNNTINLSCNGSNDGSITVVAEGGVAPYLYNWSNGASTSTISDLAAGEYFLTVTDANGCILENDYEITEPEALIVLDCNAEDITTTGGMNGTATVVISGGTAPYTYLWSNGQTSNPAINLLAGSYDVVVTDANGCETQTTCSVQSPSCAGYTILENNNVSVSCFGESDGTISVSVEGASGSIDYSWSPNVASDPVATSIPAGFYEITAIDEVGCEATVTVEVIQPEELTGTIQKTDVDCFGDQTGTLEVNVSGGTMPYQYLWSNGRTVEDLNNISSGIYTLTITDANGCVLVLTDEVLQSTKIELIVDNNDIRNTSCSGTNDGLITVTTEGGNPPFTYQWSNGATTPSLSGAVAGSYSLTVVDNSGCNINEDFEITEPEALVIVSCSSEAVTVTQGTDGVASVEVSGGTEPYTFLWSNGRTTNPATNLEAGAYSVTVTDANGCESETTCAVQQPSCSDYSVTIRSTQNVSCFGENDGSIEISVNGASGNLTYNWSGEVSSGSLATSLPAGNYEITAIDDTGCESSAAVVITEPEEFIGTTLVNDVTCFEQSNGSILVELSGGTVPYTYLWSNGSSVEDLENIGSGQFTLTVTDDNGCVLVLNDEVDEPSELAILFDEATDLVNAGCNGLSNGSISMEVEGGTSPYTYLWSNGLTTPILSGAVAGFYSLIVTDSNDCTVENSFEVTEPEALMFMECNSEDVTTTEGMDGTATVVIAGGTTPYTYKWSDGQTTNPAINLAPGSYDVSVIDAKGCGTMGTCTVQGVNCLNFEVSVNINQISCNNSEDGSIEVMVTGASGLVTFDWVPDVSSTAIGSNLSSGSYAIEVTDEVGCTEIITAELNNPTPINGSITKTNVLCNGDSDGNLDLQISGGTPPYTYSWNNGSTQEDLTNISVGDYSVTTIDANGCIFIMSETITEPQLLQEEISGGAVISNTTCTNNSAGAIDISLTGGTAPFTFLWSTGEITEDINNLTPGNYFITVTDNNNCTFGVGYDVLETTSCSSDLALIVELAPNQPAEFKEGDDVIFIITIVNQGEDDLTNITVVDYFPVGLTLNDPFWNSIGDNAATLEIGGILDAGSTTVVDMTFTVNSAAPNGLMLNYVEVASAVNSLGDPYQDVDSTPDTVNGNDAGAVAGSPTDNTFDGNGVDDEDDHDVVSFSVQAQSFDLALQTTLSGAPGTSPGEELTLLVTITNQGTIDAYNIIVNQSISETLILNDTNWTQVGNIITTTYQGPLLAGESITIPVNFILAQNAEAGVIIVISELGGATLADGTPAIDEDSTADNDFSNDAGGAPGTPSDNVIIGDGSGTPGTADANLDEDDHDPVIIVVEDLLIDLELDIMLDPRFVSINDVITWNVNVENKGPEDASGVDVLNEFGGDLVYVSDNSAGTYIAESGVWTIGDLAVGESISIEVLTRVSGLNNMELISQVSFANEDDVDSTPNNNIETEDDQDIDRPQPFRNIDVQDPCNCENGIDVDGDGNIDFAYEGIIITSASDGENWVLTSATGLVNAGGMLLTSTTLENRSGGTYLLESYAYTDGVTGFSANFEEVETGTILSISGNACNPCPVTVLNNPPNIGPDQRTCTEPITPIAICVEGFDPDGDNVAILTAETTYNCSIKVFNDTCFTYIPLPGLINVTDTVTVVACDDGNPILCNEMIVLVDVREDCDFVPPVCESNPLLLDCTEFITPLEICVPDFCKLDDDTETIVDAETIFNCSIDFLPDNCFTYTPLPGIDGVDTIYIYASDAFGALDTLVAYIIVTDDCDTYYVANDDETETTTGQPVVIDVLSNDNNNSDCEIEDLSISIATQPTNGTVTLNADGTFEYTPNDGFIGQDSFEYEVCCLAICDVALVTVTVNDDDGEPMANDDDVDTDKNTPVTIDVLENDDPVFQNCDSDDLTLKIISNPVSGSVIISLINKIVYTPNEGFIGQDSFEYEVCCADVCDVAIVTISVNDDDEEPMANDDDVDTDKDMPVTIDVLENDDPVFQNCDSDDLTLNIISDPFSGSVIVYSINEIVYTPEEGFTGEDSFEYEVCCADICDVAMVTVTVKETDLAKDDQVSTDENVPVTINVLENDDPIFQNCDSDDLTLEIVSPPFSGSVIVYSINEITYTPNEGFTGTDSFDYEVCCADVCDIATVSVIVNGKNNPPIAVDDEYVTTINETVTIEILANDYDPDGDEIEVVFIDEPNNGNVIPLSGGTYVYVPDTGFVGIDSFIYVICDDYIVPLCDTATVYITVVNNNPPMVVNEIGEEVDTIFATTLVDTPFDDCIIAVDPDGDNITIDLLQAGLNGTVMFTNDSCFVYTPNDGFVGTDTLIFIACDDGIPSLCDTVTYIIDVIDEDLIPTANPDEETTPINTPVTIPILANDILEPDEPITLEIVEEPENGTVVVTDDNEIIYTPDPDFVGLDSFIYEICDLTSCDTAIVYVNVVPDLVLELIDDAYQTDPDVPISFNVCDNDIYDGFIEVVWFEQPPMGTVGQIEDQGCDFTYIPNGSGVDCFLYVVENAVGAVDTAEVCILVNDPFDCEQIDEVQNTLTPNRDGINEVFSLDNFVTCCNNPEVIIFNRWGGIVYDNKDVQQGESWRGEHHSNAGGNGQMLPDGTYFYCVLCTDPNDPSKVEKLTGFIHLDQ